MKDNTTEKKNQIANKIFYYNSKHIIIQ